MPRTCKLAPEIHTTVMAFLQRLDALHEQGGGDFSLTEFVAALAPDFENLVAQRASVELHRTADNAGTFKNSGQSLSIKHSLVTIKIPENISGTYTYFPSSATFQFDDSNTVVGQALFFKTKLEELDANQYKVDLDLSGDAFDQCFIHAQ